MESNTLSRTFAVRGPENCLVFLISGIRRHHIRGSSNAVPLATVTGLHDVDEYMQAQLLLAVSNPGECLCPPLAPSSLLLSPPYRPVLSAGSQHCYSCLEARGLLCGQGEPWGAWGSGEKDPCWGKVPLTSLSCLPHPTDIPRPGCLPALQPTTYLLLQCALC